jgi:hypothetical protein
MQISLKQSEIVSAIRGYIETQGINLISTLAKRKRKKLLLKMLLLQRLLKLHKNLRQKWQLKQRLKRLPRQVACLVKPVCIHS